MVIGTISKNSILVQHYPLAPPSVLKTTITQKRFLKNWELVHHVNHVHVHTRLNAAI